MRTNIDLDEFLPTMNAPDKVYQLFESLGFKVLDSHLKTNPSVYNLPVKEAALVEKIYAVSNYDRRFQILLFKLKEENKEAIRTIPEKILREVDFPFIIFTPDFKTYTFTLVEKVREGPGEFKRKLTKLVVDSSQPYHTDKEILDSLTLSTDTKNPAEVYKLFQNAFSVEKVTKKFFTEYREVFEQLLKEVTKQNAHLKFTLFDREGSVENFVKILLGRLMFLYFIQKRGWLNCFDGWGSGDKKFLYHKFEEAKKDKKNYFMDYLEPLFFDTLNNPRRDKPDQATQFGGRIPFLNGGLFEPEYEYKDVSNHVFIENQTFENVFSVFEKYNFTVKEDEPLEKEVAIDPEMLGKVFENLLEENLRKGKGTYYTPREIVHYMCHESLINYLASEVGIEQEEIRNFLDREQSLEKKETLSSVIREKVKEIDEKLADIKVLDPACGSGAFLVGMLHEVINARLNLNRELGRSLSEYELKKATIQNNIYGVDIDPGAAEIAKLRLWLTLVVDHNLPEIEPLPNLDYKIMVGNSLIELLNPTLLSRTADQDRNKLIEELNITKADYSTAYDMDRKRKLREKINSLVQILVNYDQKIEKDRIWHQLLGYQGQTKIFEDTQIQPSFGDIEKKLSKKLDRLDKLKDVSATDHFEWHLNFNEVFEKGGFDVVIANPPYIGFHGVKEIREQLVGNFKSARGKFDIYIVFIERGLQLTKPSGLVTYICPTNFMKRSHGESLRKLLVSESQVIEITDFGHEQIFESVTNYTGILILQKGNPEPNHTLTYKTKLLDDNAVTFEQRKLEGKTWVIRTKDVSEIVEKLERFEVLETLADSISEGIVTGFNKFYLLSAAEIKINKFETTFFRKCLRGKEVRRNVTLPCDYLVFYPYENVNSKTKVIEEAKLKKECPNYYKFLSSNKKEILDRGYFKESNKLWFELWNRRDISQFETDKIITPELSPFNNFALAGENDFYGDTVCGITLNNGTLSLKSLLAILNSKLIEFYYKSTTVPKAGGFYIYKVMYLNDIPIAVPNKEQSDQLDELQTKILHQSSHEAGKYENQIDQLVYKLYGLTPEEVEIVNKY